MLCSKKGQQFELDQSRWITHSDLDQMHDELIKEMDDARVAVEFTTPVWMDHEGNIVDKNLSYSCKFMKEINNPNVSFLSTGLKVIPAWR